MGALAEMKRRQHALAEFGDFVLDHDDLDQVLAEGCRLVALALRAPLAKVIEIERGTQTGFVRAGVGWRDGIIGHERVSLTERSSEAYAIEMTQPVITNDIASETRFAFPAFLRDHGVVALVNVPILLPGRRPWGILQVDAREARAFDQEDVDFLKTYSMVLGPVIDRIRVAAEREEARVALSEREERLLRVLDGMGEGFGLLAPDFTILEHNREALRMDGRSRDEVVGRSHWVAFPGSEHSEIGRVLKQAMAERVPVFLEHQYTWEEGRARWLEARAYPTSDGALAVFWRDVTDRHEALDALRESEERMRLVTDAMPGLIAYVDATLHYRFVNRRYEDWFGVPAAEIAGRHLRDVMGAAALERLLPHIEMALAGRRHAFEAEVPFRTAGLRHVRSEFVPEMRPDGSVAGYYSLVLDISDYKKAEIALRESEERFRLLVESVRDYAIFTVDRAGLITSWPAGAAAVYGWTEAEILGRSCELTFTPEDVARGAPHVEIETAARDGVAPNARWHVRKDGTRIFIDGSTRPLRGVERMAREFIKIGQDVTEARRVQQALAESEERLRTLAEGIPQLVWRADPDANWTWSSPQWRAYTGQTAAQSRGQGWMAAVHPDDRNLARQAWEIANRSGSLAFDGRLREKQTGLYRWFQTRAKPVHDPSGRIVEWLGTSTDVDDIRTLQERQKIMVAELQHRTRNLMGIIRSMADKTARTSADFADFRMRYRDRLDAMARVQGLLSRLDDTDRVTFDQLVEIQIAAMAGHSTRVTLDGPRGVRLRSSTVQTLAMALHELATNAVKYGALGQPAGRLAIGWSLGRDDDGSPWLHIDWRESGVAMPFGTGGIQGSGQGRELIEKALPYQLKARTTFALVLDGVHCTIAVPVSETVPAPETVDG